MGHGAHVAFRGFHGGHRFRDFFGGFRQEKGQEILNEDGKIILEGEVGILQAEAEGRLAVGIGQEHVAPGADGGFSAGEGPAAAEGYRPQGYALGDRGLLHDEGWGRLVCGGGGPVFFRPGEGCLGGIPGEDQRRSSIDIEVGPGLEEGFLIGADDTEIRPDLQGAFQEEVIAREGHGADGAAEDRRFRPVIRREGVLFPDLDFRLHGAFRKGEGDAGRFAGGERDFLRFAEFSVRQAEDGQSAVPAEIAQAGIGGTFLRREDTDAAVFLAAADVHRGNARRRRIGIRKNDNAGSPVRFLPADRLRQGNRPVQIRAFPAADEAADGPAHVFLIGGGGENLADFATRGKDGDFLPRGQGVQHFLRPVLRFPEAGFAGGFGLHAAGEIKDQDRAAGRAGGKIRLHEGQGQQQHRQELDREEQVFPQAPERPVRRVVPEGRLPEEGAGDLLRGIFPAKQIKHHNPGRERQGPRKLRGSKC